MTRPTITALSLGAGVQSTTLALLAVEGVLPKPDVAIFADTGWEPAAVYEHLERLADVLADAGIELLKVAKGSLRADMLDPTSRFAAIPYFTQGPCGMCDATGQVEKLGLGLAYTGDRVIERLRKWLRLSMLVESVDFPLWTGKCPQCDGTGVEDGMGRRQCTSEYKLGPIQRKVRELLGAAAPDYRRVPKGRVCEQWIGFSTDEIGRVSDNDRVSYVVKRYPLLELNMSRSDCIRWLGARGWGSTTKSACIGCPFHGNRQWRDLRDNHPAEWADAVDFDHLIRKGGASSSGETLDGEAFLHRSRVPLPLAPIDRVTRREWNDRQGDLLEVLADQAAGYDPDEDGDPDGCSPYGCRSGTPVIGSSA